MKPLPDKAGVMLEEPEYFGSRSFSAEASMRFPRLAARLTEESECIHLQMGTLGATAREAIEHGDFLLLVSFFEFLESVLGRANVHSEIENAMAISFLSPVEFEKTEAGRRAWELLPARLKHVLQKEGSPP
jgi:hypothetical protein